MELASWHQEAVSKTPQVKKKKSMLAIRQMLVHQILYPQPRPWMGMSQTLGSGSFKTGLLGSTILITRSASRHRVDARWKSCSSWLGAKKNKARSSSSLCDLGLSVSMLASSLMPTCFCDSAACLQSQSPSKQILSRYAMPMQQLSL